MTSDISCLKCAHISAQSKYLSPRTRGRTQLNFHLSLLLSDTSDSIPRSVLSHHAVGRCGHPGRGCVGESGQRLPAGLAGQCRGSSGWSVPAGQRCLPADRRGRCAAGHWLPGLLRSRQGEQVYAADGEKRLMMIILIIMIIILKHSNPLLE